MKRQTLLITFSVFLGLSAVVCLPSSGFGDMPRVYQKDSRPKARSNQKQPAAASTNSTVNSDLKKPKLYETNDWVVREEVDEVQKVDDALKVFQSRKVPVYNRKVWIYNKVVNHNDAFVDFTTNDFNKDIVFSRNEKFIYYVENTPDGQSNLYGFNLANQKKFPFCPAEQFSLHTCNGKNDFIVVSEKVGGNTYNSYHIFDLEGNKVKDIDKLDKIEDLNNVVCY